MPLGTPNAAAGSPAWLARTHWEPLKVVGLNGAYDGVEFNIGTGLDDAIRQEIWFNQDAWMGSVVKFKYFPSSSKDVPPLPGLSGTAEHG